MDGNAIMFSLVPVADEISPNKKVYRAIVKTNGTKGKEELAKALAEKTGQDISLANYFLDSLNEILARHSGRKTADVVKDTDRDHFMSAEEAKEWGLIDKVIATSEK